VQLVVLAGAKVGQTFPVQQSTLIGRTEEAGVQVDDPEISRKHAFVRSLGDDRYVIEDLGSRNGTLVNGVRIERADLQLGDRIQLGSRLVLQFVRHERIEDVMRHQQRLETLGKLCAGVAHDLNNMLGVILANLDYLTLELAEEEPDRRGIGECLEDLRTATDHAAKLTPRLLSFGRADERNMARIDLSGLCSELVPVLRRTLPKSIQIQADIQKGLEIMGIAADLQQVLMNLCINARDAMIDGGTLHIEALREAASETGEAPRIQVRVRDTGEGMDNAVCERIFEPFFTTKKRGAGSGLGLATVRDIVTAHGGEIDVSATKGAGSTFRIRFPSVEPSRRATASSMRRVDTLNTLEARTVLLVGEEAIMRRGLRRLLERRGHRVIEAADGAAAIACHAESRPELVVLDLDSVNLHEGILAEIRRRDPGARVLLQSSDPNRATRETAEALGALACLRTPAPPSLFLEEVERALASVAPE
jgi:signal transduction histidine kinase/ActR/RegA family two-component response regulator